MTSDAYAQKGVSTPVPEPTDEKITGVIGVTDDGFPLVTDGYCCPYWEAGAGGAFVMRECWYCRFADFRKSSRVTLAQSVCRNPRCRVAAEEEIPQRAKNEELADGRSKK